MLRSFIVPEGAYSTKTASVFFFYFKENISPEGSVIIRSIGGTFFFANSKAPQVCVFPGEIVTSPSQSFLMLCKWEKFVYVFYKMEKSVSNVLK